MGLPTGPIGLDSSLTRPPIRTSSLVRWSATDPGSTEPMSERPHRNHIYVILRHEEWAKTDVTGTTPFGGTPTKRIDSDSEPLMKPNASTSSTATSTRTTGSGLPDWWKTTMTTGSRFPKNQNGYNCANATGVKLPDVVVTPLEYLD